MTRSPHPGARSSGPAPHGASRGAPRPPRAPKPPAGPSHRQLRVGEQIRRTLSEILASGELHDPGLEGASITVGEVRVSPDLKTATAFVLPLGGTGGEEVLQALARARPGIRHLLGRAVTLRHVPDLRFRLDDTFDRIEATERLFADERVRRDLEAAGGDGPKGDKDGEAEGEPR